MRVCYFLETPLCHIRNSEWPDSWIKNLSHLPDVGACCRTQGRNSGLSALMSKGGPGSHPKHWISLSLSPQPQPIPSPGFDLALPKPTAEHERDNWLQKVLPRMSPPNMHSPETLLTLQMNPKTTTGGKNQTPKAKTNSQSILKHKIIITFPQRGSRAVLPVLERLLLSRAAAARPWQLAPEPGIAARAAAQQCLSSLTSTNFRGNCSSSLTTQGTRGNLNWIWCTDAADKTCTW